MNIIPPNARYTGPPSRERQRELETLYFCDSDNTRGLGYGAMFRKIRGRWHYFEPPMASLSHPPVTG